jgi:hypothetical protein
MKFRTLFCTETALPEILHLQKTLLSAKIKAKILIFCKFFVLHFIAATIGIQHDLGDN